MRDSFLLACRTLVRGRFVPILFAAVALVAVFVPGLVRTDGSAAGMREMYIRAILGCATAIVAIAVLCAACGHVARAREEHRLSLAMVRPAATFRSLVGIWLAYVAAAAAVLCALAVVVYLRVPGGPVPCRHYVAPVMPSPMIAAREALAGYLADPSTPDAVRKAPRSTVLSLLASKEADRYDPIPAGASAEWKFPAEWEESSSLALRVRFATQFEMRAALCGDFSYGMFSASISNNTQSLLEIPLRPVAADGTEPTSRKKGLLAGVFRNTGSETVMLRPRRDIFLLAPGDSFAANMIRSLMHTLSGIALAAAFGLFLSSALSRPVAVFTALVAATVVFMAPSVIEQFPDELDAAFADRIGIILSRAVHSATSSLSEATPISDLAEGRFIEWAPLARALLLDATAIPLALLAAAAVVVRRKSLPDR